MLAPASSTSPSTVAPGTVSCMRLRQRSMVDLPQPDGPITAVTDLFGKSSVTFLSTRLPPNHALSRRALRSGSVSATGIPTSCCIAGDQTDDEDNGNENKRACPGLCVRRFVRTDRICEYLQRKRCDWLTERRRPELVAESSEQ